MRRLDTLSSRHPIQRLLALGVIAVIISISAARSPSSPHACTDVRPSDSLVKKDAVDPLAAWRSRPRQICPFLLLRACIWWSRLHFFHAIASSDGPWPVTLVERRDDDPAHHVRLRRGLTRGRWASQYLGPDPAAPLSPFIFPRECPHSAGSRWCRGWRWCA